MDKQKLSNRARLVIRMLLILFILSGTGVTQSFAQGKITVKGVVKDSQGLPVAGANILEKGITNGTTTDENGTFTLSVSSSESTLIISFIGYETKEVSVAGQTSIDVVLLEDSLFLDETVVIGYGTQKKVDVTSSVASVKAESFNKGAIIDAGQLVQGKVAGLQVTLPTGDPTASTSVMLRGNSTLMGLTSPLILVDGVPGSFGTVAPEEIESIDVLKDGSATAIYGTRGTNGVIIITTKNSYREQPATIEYNGYVSVSQQYKTPDFMKADDLRARFAEGWTFSGANDQDYGSDTDWLKEISQTGVSNVHNLTFRAGSKNSSILANLTFDQKEGTMKNSGITNIRGRIQGQVAMFKDILVANVSLIANESNSGLGFNSYTYRMACVQNPTQPIYNDDGTYFERSVYNYDNPISMLNERMGMNRSRNMRFTGSLELRPIKELVFKAMYTRKGQSYLSGYYSTHEDSSNTEGGNGGYASRYTSDYVGNMLELTADWKQDFGNHHLSAIAGYSYEDNTSENFGANNKEFPTDSYTYNKLETGMGLSKGQAGMSSYKQSDKLIGVFARATYNYDDRYLLMVSYRYEGSSKFGSSYHWGSFPGVSAGWRLNNEDWLRNVSWLNNLKLRAGFGITGINISAPYQSLASVDYDLKFMYKGQWISSLVPVRNANPNLHWEKKYEYNVGLDFDLFDGRLGGSIDVYQRDTKDALWDYQVPVPPYQYSYITANVGQIRNQGIEVLINAVPVRTKGFEWRTSVSYSTNKNELISISNEQFSMTTDYFYTGHTGEPIQTTTHRVKVGDPIGNFYGLKSIGVNYDGKWVVERFKRDENDNITEKYYGTAEYANEKDWQVLGNGIPKHYLNWNNQFYFCGFDLSVNMRGSFGFQILNYQKMYYANPTIQYNILNSAFDKYDVVSTRDGKKSGESVYLNDSQRYVSEYVEDGDYWKIDNLTLGYTFNTSKVKWLKNVRLYFSCYNVYTFTNYSGLDPEVEITGLTPGTDSRDKYPTVRSYTTGLNITF